MKPLFSLLLMMTLAGCDAIPRDPAGTSARIERDRRFTVGLAAPLRSDPYVLRFLSEVEKRAHARAVLRDGQGEPMLQSLGEGRLDLVIGSFAKDSPWATEVTFAPALARSGPDEAPIELKAAARNGENRWIMLVERASRAASPEAGKE